MHRTALVAAAGVLAALLSAPAAFAAHRPIALTITGQQAGVTTLDLGVTGNSAGDLTVFKGNVTTQTGAKGTVLGTAIVLRSATNGPQTASATLTYQLPDGQIVVGGLSRQAINSGGLVRGVAFTRAVLGGTGRYLGAHGS